MSTTYRAVQAIAPGKLELTEKPVMAPEPGYVRLRVEACGVCHSDAATIEGAFPISYPRVPGHEAVGVIDALGEGVTGWSLGQRVGVGFLGGACGQCNPCRRGDQVNCRNQEFTGVQRDGGYAEMMVARANSLMSVPSDMTSVAAAPLLCAGLTTFKALRNSGGRGGDLVAVIGIGGLGHLALQYARHMGFEVAAIARGADKETLARELGAHHYIDSTATDPAEALKALGGAAAILATAAGKAISETINGLRERGRMIVLGVSSDPIELTSGDLIFGGRTIVGSLTGDPATGDDTLKFSTLTGVEAMIETLPLERAEDAYARMMAGQARFRMVLTMN